MNRPERPKVLTVAEFKKALERGETPDGILRKQHVTKVEETGEDLVLAFTISSPVKDRDGDEVAIAGWTWDGWEKNPVVLFAHDYYNLPVAQGRKIWIAEDRLKSEALFTDRDLYPFGYTVYRMLKSGFLNATSVGFRALSYEYLDPDNRWSGGLRYNDKELLEYSIVPVPANPEALQDAPAKGIDIQPYAEWAEELLANPERFEGHGVWVSRIAVERVYKIVRPFKQVTISQGLYDKLVQDSQSLAALKESLPGALPESGRRVASSAPLEPAGVGSPEDDEVSLDWDDDEPEVHLDFDLDFDEADLRETIRTAVREDNAAILAGLTGRME